MAGLDQSWYAPEGIAESSGGAPAIARGALVCYRLFDVGDEIRLDELLKLLSGTEARRMALGSRHERLFEFSAAPVGLDLGERPCAPLSFLGTARARAHFFNFGVVSISFEVALPERSLAAYIAVAAAVLDEPEITAAARTVVDELSAKLRAAYRGVHHVDDYETFTLSFLQRLAGDAGPRDVLEWHGLGKLLAGETARGKLDARQREELLGCSYSYLEDDLAVIDYNAALVLEPSGSRDIPLLLELANAQLLALRYYDRLLDDDMRAIYEELANLEKKRSIMRKRYGELAHRVIRRSVEVREFSDLIGNSIKVAGDFYLARTYRGAIRRLRVGDWQESISDKLTLASEVYTMLKGELEHSRSFYLEVLVVILIVIEVVLAFVGH
ncbi:MAG: hypothetical protein U0414_33730 [Polyangiaceae bacterium]